MTITRGRRALPGLLAVLTCSVLLTACGGGTMPDDGGGTGAATSPASSSAGHAEGVSPLPTSGGFDYQLGGAYSPPAGVKTVVRDRTAKPLEGGYSVCYLNAFQAQPGDEKRWDDGLLLEVDGKAVTDPDWPDETLLDTSTASKRDRIATALTPWIRGCADDGFDAVEFDNLDSYTRSHGALTRADNAALATSLTRLAHEHGLAAAQKNIAEHAATLKKQVGFDLAVSEECAANEECGEYTSAYGNQVVDIEYTDNLPESFAGMCKQEGTPKLMILRDRDLVTPRSKGYVFRACP